MPNQQHSLTISEISRMARGEGLVDFIAVPGASLPQVKLRALINAPLTRVWPIIDQCQKYCDHLPGVIASEELSRQGEHVRARVTVKMPFPLKDLTSLTSAIHTVEEGKRYERKWILIEGDFEKHEGSWLLLPFDGDPQRTLLQYVLHAIPKIPIPKSLLQLVQKMAVPRLLHRLRELTETE
jgi:ribosome-associated toxin RatA of RatAB toxin-antitoxin module